MSTTSPTKSKRERKLDNQLLDAAAAENAAAMESSQEPAHKRKLQRLVLPFLAAFLLYRGNLHGPMVFDDTSAVSENKDVSEHPFSSMWSNNFWGDSMGSPMAR